jgi:predicted MFS family arabinose efflux permease
MKRFILSLDRRIWTSSLTLMASAVFLIHFGESVLWGTRTNFFVDTLNLTGGQVLWLEGMRELPGLMLMFIAAFAMRLPLSWRAAAAVLITGVGYVLYATVGSYSALLAVAVFASLGMHMWFPLQSALGMSLSTKDKAGLVLGTLRSVGALASLISMGVLSLVARLAAGLSLRAYYVIGGVFVIIASVLIFRLPKEIGSTAEEQPRMLLKRRYWLYYVLTFFEGSRKQVLNTFGMLVLVESFNLQVWQISLILLVSGIINMLAGPYIGALVDRFGERWTVSFSYAVLALCCLGFAVVGNVWVLVGLLFLIKLMVMMGMGLSTYVYRIAPAEELTPTLSAGISINHVTSVAMPLLAGALLPYVGYEGIFAGTAGMILASIPFAWMLKISQPLARQAEPAL